MTCTHGRSQGTASLLSLLGFLISLLVPSVKACTTTITSTGTVYDQSITGNGGSVSFTPPYTTSDTRCQITAELYYWHDVNNLWQSYTEIGIVTAFTSAASSYWDGSNTRYHRDAGYTTFDVANTASAYKPYT